METQYLVDWFSFSILGDYTLSDVFKFDDGLPVVAAHQPAEMKPLRRYSTASALTPAGRMDTGAKSQGRLVTFTGGDLAALGMSGVEIAKMCAAVGAAKCAQVARIDLAADVVDAGAKADDIYQSWLRGGTQTRAGKVTRIEARTKTGSLGVTVSVGSRTSERFMRVYDKGAQTKGKGDYGSDWLRVEVEAKGRYAGSIAAAVAAHGPAATIKTVVLSYITVGDVQWWVDLWADAGQGAAVLKPGRKVTTSDTWLHTVALSHVVEAIKAGDAIVISQIMGALREAGLLTD